jgi:hypothetical protein
MKKKEFIEKVKEQLALAEKAKDGSENVLDLRVTRYPYYFDDTKIFLPHQLDEIYEFIKEAPNWYVDIYENIAGENLAVYTDYSVIGMQAF